MNMPEEKPQRSPWPYVITIVYGSFFLALVGFLYYTIRHNKVELVSKDYYAREVKYQEQIDREQNGLSATAYAFDIQAAAQVVSIQFPAAGVTGDITFYRPADAALDFKIPIATAEDGSQVISTSKLAEGLWKIRVHWNEGGREFFREHTLVNG